MQCLPPAASPDAEVNPGAVRALSQSSVHGARVPPKIRELIVDLQEAGFVDRGGKGSHRNFVHPKVAKPITISGAPGDDAKHYQVRAVRRAVEESKA
jgi:predicted RNA binding protein YcfA (HicA-like mRNA interferase family)